MADPRVSSSGGFAVLSSVLRQARTVGWRRLSSRLGSKNTCRGCGYGIGGRRGGGVDEAGRGRGVCLSAVHVAAADLAPGIEESFFSCHSIRGLGQLSSSEFDGLGRLTFPLLAEPDKSHFRRISWDEALDRIGEALREAPPDQTFYYASGRSSNEAAFLLQLVARAKGCPHLHSCASFCHSASEVALEQVTGSHASSVRLEDLDRADLVLLCGANPSNNHPRLIPKLVELRERGGKVIVINPLREPGLTRYRIPTRWKSLLFGSTVSDSYLQPHVGSDVALLKAILKGIHERYGVDRNFCNAHTMGWAEVEVDLAMNSRWEDLLGVCGVSREEVDSVVEALLAAERGIMIWSVGLTHHLSGVDNVLALSNLALSQGWVGQEGTGLLPLRGHSNEQGLVSMGMGPSLMKAFGKKMAEVYGVNVGEVPGRDTLASVEAAANGEVQTAVLLGGNLFGSHPDREWASRALQKIPLTISITTKLNDGHIHGRGQTSILLPALTRDEETQATTQESMFSLVRSSLGGEGSPRGELRSEVEIVAAFARRMLGDAPEFDWDALRSHEHLRSQMARIVPGYERVTELDKGTPEIDVEGRRFAVPKFDTPDGRARFSVTAVSPRTLAEGQFRLMTVRSQNQFNTVVYRNEDRDRGNTRRDVVMMNEGDARKLALVSGERVRVRSDVGSMDLRVSFVDIKSGNLAVYFPEANRLVPRKLDPRSKTPAFKSVDVRVEKRS